MTAAPLPYVGPRALLDGEVLYGRTQEVEDLLDLLVANRVALLYSPSGAGKSSLINAGLLPRLREEGFTVAPVVRIDRPPAADTDTETRHDRFLESLLASLSGDPGFSTGSAAAGSTAQERLTALLQAHAADDLVLVLDQFETLFTLDPADRAAKVAFMTALGALVNRRTMGPVADPGGQGAALDPRPWLLIVLREEFLAALDPYRHLVSGGLDARMRLELLDPERARAAIRGPAAASGVTIDDDAAQALVDDLCAIEETDEDGTVTTVPGPTVEPVQLQVACLRLWLQLQPEAGTTITRAQLPPSSGVSEALGAYYAESVAAIARDTGASELEIRDWFGESLVVQHAGRSIRAQVRDGVSPAVRSACEDAHLLRGDERAGVRWYELAHDRLVSPVIEDNARWLREHARPLLLRARAWEAGGRDASLLLRGKDLKDAQAVVAGAADVTAVEEQLLAASLGAERAQRRGRRQRQAFLGLAALVGALVLAAAWLGLSFADQARKSTAGRLAVLAERQVPWIASVQRLLAADLSGGTQPLLATASCCAPELRRIGIVDGGRVTAVAFDADGRGLLWGQDGERSSWRSPDGSAPTRLSGLSDVRALAWSTRGNVLAVGDGRGRVRLLDAVAVKQTIATGKATGVTTLVAPDATGTQAGLAGRTTPEESPSAEATDGPGSGPAPGLPSVTALGWSEDGTTLAAALTDARVIVWRAAAGAVPDATTVPIVLDVARLASRPVQVAVSADGGLVAVTAELGGPWAVWPTAGDGEPRTLDGVKGGAIAFLPGTPARLLVAGEAGRVALVTIPEATTADGAWGLTWDGTLPTPGDGGVIRDLAVAPADGAGVRVALARKNGTVQVIAVDDAGGMTQRSESLAADPDEAEHVAWSADGGSLAVSGRDRSLSIWSVPPPVDGPGPGGPPLAVLVLDSGTSVAVAPDGHIIRTGPEASPFAVAPPDAGSGYEAAAIAPDGRSVALGRRGASVVVLRDADPTVLSIDGSATPDLVTDIVFDQTGTRIAVATARQVRAWELVEGSAVALSPPVELKAVNPRAQVAWDASGTGVYVGDCGDFSPNGAACLEGTVTWHPMAGDGVGTRNPITVKVDGWPWSLAVDPVDASHVIIGLKNGRVDVVRFGGPPDESPLIHTADLVRNTAITQLAVAGAGPARLAVGSQSGRVLLVDPDGLWVVATGVGGSHGEVSSLSYAADAGLLAIGAGRPAQPRPVAAPGAEPLPTTAPDRVTGAVQLVDLHADQLRRRVCDLAAWMSRDDETRLLLGQARPTCP